MVSNKLKARMKQACTPAHFLANVLDPRYGGSKLSSDEVDAAMKFVADRNPNIMSKVHFYRAKSGPFKAYMFHEDVLKSVTSLAWWMSQSDQTNEERLALALKILGAKASSAYVERIFSTFGLVQSEVRNRLGTTKSAKLVFMYKLLNDAK